MTLRRLSVLSEIKSRVTSTLTNDEDGSEFEGNRKKENEGGTKEYDKSLGVHMFYSMLEFLHRGECTQGDRQEVRIGRRRSVEKIGRVVDLHI